MKYVTLIAAIPFLVTVYGQLMTSRSIVSPIPSITCVSNVSWGSDSAGSFTLGDNGARAYTVTSNQWSYTWNLCTLGERLKRNGTGTAGNLTAKIWANSSGSPGTLLYTSVNTVASSDVGTSDQWVQWTFSNAILTNNTPYWIGLQSSAIDAANYYTLRNGAFGIGVTKQSADGSTWGAAVTRTLYQSGWSLGAVTIPPATNSFDLYVNFESGSDGAVSSSGLTAGTTNIYGWGSGTWTLDSAATNVFLFAGNAQNTFPTNYWWSNSLASDSGVRGLAITFTNTSSVGIKRSFTGVPLLSFGFYHVQKLTNTAPSTMFSDMLYIESSSAQNTAIVEWRTDSDVYYAHGISNAVSQNGGYITGVSIGDTNWITGLVTSSNFTMAVYSPTTWSQVGTNSSIGLGSDSWIDLRVLSHLHGSTQPGITNYVDNFIIKTNGVFPIIPTNFTTVHTP